MEPREVVEEVPERVTPRARVLVVLQEAVRSKEVWGGVTVGERAYTCGVACFHVIAFPSFGTSLLLKLAGDAGGSL